MTRTLKLPDFNWSARFYADFRQAVRQSGRLNVPELTEEDDADPYMQLEGVVSLVGHLLSSRLDFVARHLYLPTSLRRGAVAALLRLIDERLLGASPAVADVTVRLTRRFTADQPNLVPARSLFGTVPEGSTPTVYFETGDAAQGCARNDRLIAYGYDQSTGLWVAWTAAHPTPWVGPGAAGDAVYIGHADLLFDGCAIALAVVANPTSMGVWEYSGSVEDNPTGVTWGGGNLTFDLSSILGAATHAGAQVTIYCALTGQSVTFTSTFVAVNRVVTANTLGQVGAPSTLARDYICSVDWAPLSVDGGNADLGSLAAVATDLAWTLPQGLDANWQSVEINGQVGFWVRWRVLSAGTAPQLSADVAPGDDAEFYALLSVTQGQTVLDTVGSSDGSANQVLALNRTPYIQGTLTGLTVGTDAAWVVTEEASDFYAADPTEKLVLLEMLPDGTYQLLFGDGADHAAVPPAGDAVSCTYRISADSPGNVGAGTITRNVSGLAYVTDATNPRAAVGWDAAEGSTVADLERVKRDKPAAMRARNRIVTAGDAAALVVSGFLTAAGSRPVARAWGVEERYGLKSIGLVLVGNGGGVLPAATLAEINDWANGTDGDPNSEDRLLMANLELVATNYVDRPIDGTITVTVQDSAAGVDTQVQAILADLLQPLKTRDDGSWMWTQGAASGVGRVSPTFIAGWVFSELTVRTPLDVVVDVLEGVGPPAATEVLAQDELPSMGTWAVNVVVV